MDAPKTHWVRHENGALEEIGDARLEELGDSVEVVDPPYVSDGDVVFEEREDGWYYTEDGETFGPYVAEANARSARSRRGSQ